VSKGLGVWALALLLGVLIPGTSRGHALGPFPWLVTALTLGLCLALAATTLFLVERLGPVLAARPPLALWEAIPDLLWGALALVCWPAAWGPPGFPALALAFLLAALPGELRWLAQTLPRESPFPAAWGPRAIRISRRLALRSLLPRWLLARLPLWITATLILERMLGVRGPSSDWMMRLAFRDHWGVACWILGFALLWVLLQREGA